MIKKLKPIGNVLLGILVVIATPVLSGIIIAAICKGVVLGWTIVF